jgi:hypothetical protein
VHHDHGTRAIAAGFVGTAIALICNNLMMRRFHFLAYIPEAAAFQI